LHVECGNSAFILVNAFSRHVAKLNEFALGFPITDGKENPDRNII